MRPRVTLAVLAVAAGCKAKSRDQAAPPPPDPPPIVAVAPDAPAHVIGSPLPEVGPDPDYPTPIAAGTDKIFSLEDPERGPKAPLTYATPARGTLAWTTHANCEADLLDMVCSAAPGKGLWMWRVGRKGKNVIVAEYLRGARVESTYIYDSAAAGGRFRVELDAYGRVASALMVPTEGRYSGRKRTGANELDGCGFMAYKLDVNRRVAELGCLQWLGDPMRDTTGVATTRFVRDPHGFPIEKHCLGLDGAPIANNDGFAIVLTERDPDGRVTVERYRDVDARPVADLDGCHGRRLERDHRGTRSRVTCLDADDAPATAASGISVIVSRTDARGCEVGVRYLDVGGRPMTDRDNVHGFDRVVDQRCAVTSSTCLNVVEQPLACGLGAPARLVHELDPAGNIVSTKHHAADGAPGADSEYGVFEVRRQWDDLGNEIGMSCYDDAGKPVECGRTGFHATTATFDDAGRQTDERYYDQAGAPTTNLGAVSHRYRYDNYDHSFETLGYDAAGKPMEVLGSAIRRDLYDSAHRRFGILQLDPAGKPASYGGCYTGVECPGPDWHAVRIERRADGAVVTNKYFDARGQLIATVDCSQKKCFE